MSTRERLRRASGSLIRRKRKMLRMTGIGNVCGNDDAGPEAELHPGSIVRQRNVAALCAGCGSRFGAHDAEGLARGLNLTRYIAKSNAAIIESKVKASETEAAARLCGELR